jgi:hypothetical protein
MRGRGRDERLFSRRNSSTSWSRLMSSLPRLFLGLKGLPSRPSRTFFRRRGSPSPSPSASSVSWPARRRRALSVSDTLRLRASSPRSISISLPCMVNFRGSACRTAGAAVASTPAPACVVVVPPFSADSSCRWASFDSTYSILPGSAAPTLTPDNGDDMGGRGLTCACSPTRRPVPSAARSASRCRPSALALLAQGSALRARPPRRRSLGGCRS